MCDFSLLRRLPDSKTTPEKAESGLGGLPAPCGASGERPAGDWPQKKELMKIGLLLTVVAATGLLCGCKQTAVTHSITVKVAADGARTVTETKSVSQYVEISKTDSTKAILKEFDSK